MKNIIGIENYSVAVDAQYFALASTCAGKGDVRYYLNGVYIEPAPGGKGAILVGCDGHRMIAMHDRNGVCNQSVIISTTPHMLTACRRTAQKAVFPEVKLVLAGDQLTVGFGGIGDSSVSMEPIYRHPGDPRIDGKYIDWRRAIPKENIVPGLPGQYNADYLAAFVDLAKYFDRKTHAITFFHQDNGRDQTSLSAVVVRAPSNKDFLGVLMPMRSDVPEAIPEWVKAA